MSFLDFVVDRDEAARGHGVPAARIAATSSHSVGAHAGVQDGDHRAAAVTGRAFGIPPARRRLDEDRDRVTRVAAAEQVRVGGARPADVAAVARAPGDAAAPFGGRAPGDGRADKQMLQLDAINLRLVDDQLPRGRGCPVRVLILAGRRPRAASAAPSTRRGSPDDLAGKGTRTAARGSASKASKTCRSPRSGSRSAARSSSVGPPGSSRRAGGPR